MPGHTDSGRADSGRADSGRDSGRTADQIRAENVDVPVPRWGLGAAIAGWVGGLVFGSILFGVWVATTGQDQTSLGSLAAMQGVCPHPFGIKSAPHCPCTTCRSALFFTSFGLTNTFPPHWFTRWVVSVV